MGKATVDPAAVSVPAEAAKRASERGTKFVLVKATLEIHDTLRAGRHSHLVEVLPRSGAGA